MRMRSFLFGGIFGGALSSLPRVFKKKGIYISDFGYKAGRDNTLILILAEAAAFLKGQTLHFPKDEKIILSKPILFRVSVEGNGAELISKNSSVLIRIKNERSLKELKISSLNYNGQNIANGFFVDETKDVLVKNCIIKNCLDVGISIYESEQVQLVHNQIEGSPKLIIDKINSRGIREA
jgi:hypothetical protein